MEISPGPPQGDTNDECTTIPTGWECVIQNGTNTDLGWEFPGFPAGATVTYQAPSTTDGVTFTPATCTTSAPPYLCYFVETAASTAPVGNQYSAAFNATISGSPSYCSTNYCGPDGPFYAYFQVSCALSLNHCPVLDVTDTDLNKVVSATPPPTATDWVVGLQKNLKAAIRSGSGSGTYPTIVSTTWTKPSQAVAGYTFGANKTVAPTDLTSLSNQTLQFYWMSGNNTNSRSFKVTQVVKRSDGQETADAKTSLSYLVNTPGGISVGATYSVTQVGKYNSAGNVAVSSGTALNYPSSAGIELDFKATAPSAIPGYAGGGDFAASQVILSSHDTTSTLPAADGCALYTVDTSGGNGTGRNLFASAGQSVTYNAIDAPAEFGLPASGKAITYGDSFIDYFVYRPSGTNVIWVSLGSLSWAWEATVTNNGGTYVLTNVTNSNQATKSYSTTEPVWNSINGPLGSGCHSLPTH